MADDLTVYDLAVRMAAGQPLSDAAAKEVATELLRVVTVLQAYKWNELVRRIMDANLIPLEAP